MSYMQKPHECVPSLHCWVPLIEGDRTIGLVCTTCDKIVRDDSAVSGLVINESGILKDEKKNQ